MRLIVCTRYLNTIYQCLQMFAILDPNHNKCRTNNIGIQITSDGKSLHDL